MWLLRFLKMLDRAPRRSKRLMPFFCFVYIFVVFLSLCNIERKNDQSNGGYSLMNSWMDGEAQHVNFAEVQTGDSTVRLNLTQASPLVNHRQTERNAIKSYSLSNSTKGDFDNITEPHGRGSANAESHKHNSTVQAGGLSGQAKAQESKNDTGINKPKRPPQNQPIKRKKSAPIKSGPPPILLNYKVNAPAGPLYSNGTVTPHPFHFMLSNSHACQKGNYSTKIFVLILVKCRPSEKLDRMQIRRTWGGVTEVRGKRTLTMFLIGQTEDNETETRIAKEDDEYHDIIQENFIDSYYNMTHKNIMGLKWVHAYCPNASFVLSIDADMTLNIYNLVLRMENRSTSNFTEGHLRSRPEPHRSKKSKWFTPKEFYPEPSYAPFLNGACYVMSVDVAKSLYQGSAHVRYLPWDDVFIGLVMKMIGVVPKNSALYEQFRSKNTGLEKGIAIGVGHNTNTLNEAIIKLWDRMLIQAGLVERGHRYKF